MVADKLALNLTKFNVIIINPKNSPIGTKPNTVSIYQHFLLSLSAVTAAKCSVVVLDDGLSFKTHINMWTKKLSTSVGVFFKVKLFLNKSSLLSLYYGIFHFHLQYGILAWSATYKSYHNRIATLYNNAAKITSGGKWNNRTSSVFYAKSIYLNLMISSILKKHAFYLHKSHKLPFEFNNYFNYTSDNHEKYIRGSSCFNYFLPFY